MAQWKKSVENVVSLDLKDYDYYGVSGFDLAYQYLGSDEITVVNQDQWYEIIKPIDDVQVTADGDTPAGSNQVGVDDVSNISIGMVFKVKDKDIYFYVDAIDTDNNIVTTRKNISGDIADGDEINRVGNTGIYQCKLTFDEAGIVTLLVENTSIGLQEEVQKIDVVDNSDIDSKLDSISEKLDRVLDRDERIRGVVVV